MTPYGQGGKNYDYILENKCIYCGRKPKEGEIFNLDNDEDKVCPAHEKRKIFTPEYYE